MADVGIFVSGLSIFTLEENGLNFSQKTWVRMTFAFNMTFVCFDLSCGFWLLILLLNAVVNGIINFIRTGMY